MNGKTSLYLLCFLALAPALFGSSKESLSIQEFRITLQDFSREIHATKSEIEILQDKIDSFNQDIASIRESSSKNPQGELEGKADDLQKKVSNLEANQKVLLSDIKTLKDHINESNLTLAKCEAHVKDLDKQLSSELKAVKNSLQSMLAYMQKGSSPVEGGAKVYVVKNGDSLGKIAQENKVSIKHLKEINQLSSDQIRPGQKLQLE